MTGKSPTHVKGRAISFHADTLSRAYATASLLSIHCSIAERSQPTRPTDSCFLAGKMPALSSLQTVV